MEPKPLSLAVVPVPYVEGFHCFSYNQFNAAAGQTMFPAGKIYMYVFNLAYILINMLIWSNLEHQKALLFAFISICFQ